MKCRNLFFRVLFLIVFPCGFVLSAPDAEEQFLRAQTALRAREFSQAVKAFSGLYRAELSAPDQALYLQAVACFYDKKFSACRAACDKILSDYPESDWYRKAVFLQASAFVEEKNWPEAEKIYEAEARRLLSGARKDEIAGVIVAFADDLCVEPGADELDRPQPNYYKAYSLYARVMEMEIGRDLRDEVLFKRATAISKVGNPHQAINDFKQYLQEFDPRWHGLVGEPVVGAKDELRQGVESGAHIMQARFKLAEALLGVGQQHQCRWEADELLALLADVEDPGAERLAAETRRLLVRSFSLPNPSSDFEQAVDAVHDFLKHHPAHPHAVKIAFDLAVAYQNQGRSDDAVAAYQAFIDGTDYRLPAGVAATDVIEDLNASPVELQEKLTREALFRIGAIRLAQKRYDEAIARWESYVARYPNGPHWAQCQNSIIDAEFQIGLDAVEEEDYVRAREVFEEFLRQHPLDPRAPQILFIFGQMHYAKAEAAAEANADELERLELEAAVSEWRRLVGKYPGSEPASAALYRIGMIQEEKFGDMEAALDSYRRLNWGSFYQKAQQRIAAMTNKRLAIESERIFRTDETPGIRLETRNIEKVTVRIYRLNLDAYFRGL
jgi:outer membrane protein assembly factor BamD (BamD/ComL family)